MPRRLQAIASRAAAATAGALLLTSGASAFAATPRDGDWAANGSSGRWSEVVYFSVEDGGRNLDATNSLVGNPTDPCSWSGQWSDEPLPITGGAFDAHRDGAGPPETNNHIDTHGVFSNSGQLDLTMTVSCVRYRPGLPKPIPYPASETYTFSALLTKPDLPLGLGGALGAGAHVYVQTCAEATGPVLVRPRKRAAHPRRRVCSSRRRLGRHAAKQAWKLPVAVPSAPVQPVVPPPCPFSLDVQSDGLSSRRDACPAVAAMELQALIVKLGGGPEEAFVAGTGLAWLGRRFDLHRGDPRWRAEIGYRGVSGILADGAQVDVRPSCAFRFGTRCFGDPENAGELHLTTGTVGAIDGRIHPAALAADKDFMSVQTDVHLEAVSRGGPTSFTTGIIDPGMRCDQIITPAQACVYDDFTPTLRQPPSRIPEIAANIAAGQAAGLPGAPGAEPLTRTKRAYIRDNRRLACPAAIRKQYRRERPDGSCDEYPFASTDQGGVNVRRANVPLRENQIQGGLIGGFYANQRILTGDPFWVSAAP